MVQLYIPYSRWQTDSCPTVHYSKSIVGSFLVKRNLETCPLCSESPDWTLIRASRYFKTRPLVLAVKPVTILNLWMWTSSAVLQFTSSCWIVLNDLFRYFSQEYKRKLLLVNQTSPYAIHRILKILRLYHKQLLLNVLRWSHSLMVWVCFSKMTLFFLPTDDEN